MIRAQFPGPFIVLGGKGEFVALFRQPRQFAVAAEVVGRKRERLFPAVDALTQGAVDVFERLRCGCVGLPIAVEDAPRRYLLMSFVAQECVFEGHLIVARIEAHGRGKLIARGGGFSHLQKRVGEILADRRTVRRQGDGALEAGDGTVILLGLQGLIGFV